MSKPCTGDKIPRPMGSSGLATKTCRLAAKFQIARTAAPALELRNFANFASQGHHGTNV